MNATPSDNDILPVPPKPHGEADTPAERYAAYLDYAFSPETHRKRYAIAVSLLLLGIAIAGAAAYVGKDVYAPAWLGLPVGVLLAGRALLIMHRMVRRAQQYQKRKQVARKGELVTGYIVQCSSALLRPGPEAALPCRVLFSFESEVGEDGNYMRYLAGRVANLKGRIPCGDIDRQYIAALASEMRATPNRRYILPLSFTDGSTVYLADLFISRAHLPGGYLQADALPCLAEPGTTGNIELMPEWLMQNPPSRTPTVAPAKQLPPPAEDEPPFPLG